jgi:hypothetical protein
MCESSGGAPRAGGCETVEGVDESEVTEDEIGRLWIAERWEVWGKEMEEQQRKMWS